MLLHKRNPHIRTSANSHMKFVFILIAIIFFHLTSVAQQSFVLATYTYSTNNRLANLTPLADYLSKETGQKFTAVSFATVQELIDAIRDRKVDLAMINTLGYLSMQKKYKDAAYPLVTLDMGNANSTNYGGCLLAAKSQHITSVKQLLSTDKPRRLALVGKSSTSGNLVPRLILNQAGISSADEHFLLYYAGTHKQVIEDLLAGKASVGGCGCDEYEKNKERIKDSIVMLASFNDIPLGPIVYRKGLSAELTKKIATALSAAHDKQPAIFKNFLQGWTEFKNAVKFKPAADTDYNEFRAMFGSNESLWKLLE